VAVIGFNNGEIQLDLALHRKRALAKGARVFAANGFVENVVYFGFIGANRYFNQEHAHVGGKSEQARPSGPNS
jgi:hypothetical protein